MFYLEVNNQIIEIMKVNELRIGNWFKGDMLGGTERRIIPKDIENLFDDPQDDFYQPIPLTEEWLLKFGFDKTDDYGDQVYYEKGSYYICYDHEQWNFGLIRHGDCTNLIYDKPYFQCVHQLQNLYFALTGEELEMK